MQRGFRLQSVFSPAPKLSYSIASMDPLVRFNSLLSGVSNRFVNTDKMYVPDITSSLTVHNFPACAHTDWFYLDVKSKILPTSHGKHFESAFNTHWFHSQSASTWNKNAVNASEVCCDQRRYCELYGVAGATEISLDAAVKAVLFNVGWHFRFGRLKIRTEVFCGHFFTLLLTQYGRWWVKHCGPPEIGHMHQ